MIKKSFMSMSILLKNNHKNRTFFYRYTFLLYKSNCLSSSLLKINLLTNKSQVCTFVHHCTQFLHQCTHFLYTMLNYFQRRNNVRRMSQLLTFEQTSKLIRFPNSVFHHLGRKSGRLGQVYWVQWLQNCTLYFLILAKPIYNLLCPSLRLCAKLIFSVAN